MDSKKYRNPIEASEYIGVSVSWLAKLRLYGGGPRYSKIGRSIRYSTDDLDAWLASNLQTTTSGYDTEHMQAAGDYKQQHRMR